MAMNKKLNITTFLKNNIRKIITLIITVLIHIFVIVYVGFDIMLNNEDKRVNDIFKMVDIEEYTPPPPEEKKVKKEDVKIEETKKEDVVEINKQETITEEVLETQKEVKEIEIDYLPQHKVTTIPQMPTKEIKSRIIYPPLAYKQGIEGVVYLELYIDKDGKIKKINVLKDPGYGLTEASLKALEGIKVIPAMVDGVAVAVKFRYPIRFTLENK